MPKPKAVDESKIADGLKKALDGQVVKATGAGAASGIFGSAKAVFDRAKELGYVEECEGPPAKGKTKPIFCRITEKGRSWLVDRISPRQILEALVDAVAGRKESTAKEASEGQFLKNQIADLRPHG